MSERGKYPSGSAAKRLEACPGSHLLELSCADPDAQNAEGEEGTMLHAVMAGKFSEVGLSSIHKYLINTARRLVDQTISESGIEPAHKIIEDRLWLHDVETLEPLISGQMDLVVCDSLTSPDAQAILIDYKFGFGGAGAAADNTQLEVYAGILYRTYGFKRILAALVQPRLDDEDRLTRVWFNEGELILAEQKAARIAKAVMSPDAPRAPGSHCRWCKAKGICPESTNLPTAVARLKTFAGDKVDEFLQAPVTPDELALYEQAEWVIEARRARALEQLHENPQSIAGWKLPKGQNRSSIEDTPAALKVIADRFPQAAPRLPEITSVSLTDIVELVADAQKLSGKAAKESVRSALGPIIKDKVTEPKKPVHA